MHAQARVALTFAEQELVTVDHGALQVGAQDSAAADPECWGRYRNRTRMASVGVDRCVLDETRTGEEEGMVVPPEAK